MANHRWMGWLMAACALTATTIAPAAEIVVELPEGVEVVAASATAPDTKLQTAGQVAGGKATFPNLLPDVPYDLALQLADGTVLQGFSVDWYANDAGGQAPADAAAEPASEDDVKQIDAIVTQIPQFYNRSRVLYLNADHQRAVALVELIRDSDFYAGKGQVVWRVELWYFQNQFGGWEKVQQQNKILRRERYKTVDAYRQATEPIRWLPQLGGIRTADDRPITVTLTQQQVEPTLAQPPASHPAPAD